MTAVHAVYHQLPEETFRFSRLVTKILEQSHFPPHFLPMSKAEPERAIQDASFLVMNLPSAVSISSTLS